jgi:phosphohistidine phosphatase
MKTLYLVRHAKAISRERPGPDFARPLRKQGTQDARRLARHLKHHGPLPDLILASPANRAIETARIFAEAWGYPTDNIRTHAVLYDQSEAAAEAILLPLIQATENAHQTLMIVGHDPLLTAFTHVLHPDFTAWLPTCGTVCSDFQVETWADVAPGRGTLRFFFTPKSLVPPPAPSEAQIAAAIVAQLHQILAAWHPDVAVTMHKVLQKSAAKVARQFIKRL